MEIESSIVKAIITHRRHALHVQAQAGYHYGPRH